MPKVIGKKTSTYRGVHWSVRYQKWQTTVSVKDKSGKVTKTSYGHFINERDAGLAYDKIILFLKLNRPLNILKRKVDANEIKETA